MALRPCLGCKKLISEGSYCPICAWQTAVRYSDRMRGRRWMKIRSAVMRRAEWICQRCGDRLAEECHHLNGVDDNRLESLLAVCRDCHTALEAEKRAAKRAELSPTGNYNPVGLPQAEVEGVANRVSRGFWNIRFQRRGITRLSSLKPGLRDDRFTPRSPARTLGRAYREGERFDQGLSLSCKARAVDFAPCSGDIYSPWVQYSRPRPTARLPRIRALKQPGNVVCCLPARLSRDRAQRR
jgi:hypothetical protein